MAERYVLSASLAAGPEGDGRERVPVRSGPRLGRGTWRLRRFRIERAGRIADTRKADGGVNAIRDFSDAHERPVKTGSYLRVLHDLMALRIFPLLNAQHVP